MALATMPSGTGVVSEKEHENVRDDEAAGLDGIGSACLGAMAQQEGLRDRQDHEIVDELIRARERHRGGQGGGLEVETDVAPAPEPGDRRNERRDEGALQPEALIRR